MDPRAIRFDVEGMPELHRAALEECGKFAGTTLWLAIGVVGAIAGATTLALLGAIPLWVGGAANFCSFVAGYTVGHEIIHNNLTGRRRDLDWLNKVFGTVFFSVGFHSLTMHRFIHLRHHAHTNDAAKDPDAWINGRNPLELAFRLATHYPHYNYYAVKAALEAPGGMRFIARSMIEQVAPMIVAGACVAAGFGREALILWIGPAILLYPFLAFVLDWAPHHDLPTGSPCETSRLLGAPKGLLGKAFSWLYLFQNYHLIHHLWPRVPFYRYAALYEKGRPALARAGAKISPLFDEDAASARRA